MFTAPGILNHGISVKIETHRSFIRDAKNVPTYIRDTLPSIIQKLEQVTSIVHVPRVKKISRYKNAYRIRIDDYRIGIYIENDVVILSRILHRKDIYKKFPR